MITPSFGLTATERVLPKLALDFTTANLDSRVTFTRSGDTATVVNSSGYVAPINANLPRFDYNPTTLVCNGLLIEEARTNIYTYSEQLDNLTWIVSGSVLTPNLGVSPDGTQNADQLATTATTSSHDIRQAVTTVISSVYTATIYAKKITNDFLQICLLGDGTPYANFNLADGTLGTSSGLVSSSITNAGNGYYRCSITYTAIGVGISPIYALVNSSSATRRQSWSAAGTEAVYLWGAQVELGAFPTSYIPTTTTSLTRSADVATMTGTNFSDWYNQTEGTLYAEWTSFATINTTVCVLTDDISSALSVQLLIQSRNANTQIRIWQSTTGGGLDNSAILSSVTGQGKATAAYVNNTSFAGSANAGAVVSTGVTPQALTANALRLGANPGGLGQLDGYLKKIMYWPQKLTNAELQAFSK